MFFFKLFSCSVILILFSACSPKIYKSNGERIYKTGKNEKGEYLLDRESSRITFVKSCQTCHGKKGDLMRNTRIKAAALMNPYNFPSPYTDSLFFRFLDQDLKSNGQKADIGVIWKMSAQDKKDLWEYLKSL